MKIEQIALHEILRPLNPARLAFDEDAMRELTGSISNLGLINPITIEPEQDHYRLIAGDRRLEAHRRLGLATIACIIRDPHDATITEALNLAENLERADLTPWEEARKIHHLHNNHQIGIEKLAAIAHRSEDWIKRRLQLAELPEDLAPHVHERRLSIGCALALADITEPQHRDYLTRYALDAGASVQCIREWVNSWRMARDAGNLTDPPRPPPLDLTGPVVITMPCWVCGEPHDHTTLLIMRVCRGCVSELHTARASEQRASNDPAVTLPA